LPIDYIANNPAHPTVCFLSFAAGDGFAADTADRRFRQIKRGLAK
jgi:hypothetical protein